VVGRYLFHLRRGEEHRKWLLTDMRFEDPYGQGRPGSFDLERVNSFERRAMEHAMRVKEAKEGHLAREMLEISRRMGLEQTNGDDEDDDDDWSDDEDEVRGLPEWCRNPRSL
jgi:hypothetical protein